MLQWSIKNFLFKNLKKYSRRLNETYIIIGCDGLNGNIIMGIYGSIKIILFKIFKASYLEEAVFPGKLEISKVIPVFKIGNKKMWNQIVKMLNY